MSTKAVKKSKKQFPIDLRKFRYDGVPLTPEYKSSFWGAKRD